MFLQHDVKLMHTMEHGMSLWEGTQEHEFARITEKNCIDMNKPN